MHVSYTFTFLINLNSLTYLAINRRGALTVDCECFLAWPLIFAMSPYIYLYLCHDTPDLSGQ